MFCQIGIIKFRKIYRKPPVSESFEKSCRLQAKFYFCWTISYLISQDVFKRNSERQTSMKLDIGFVRLTWFKEREFISWSIRPQVFSKKETARQVFSCEYWEIFKNTYSEEYLWVAAYAFLQWTPSELFFRKKNVCARISPHSFKELYNTFLSFNFRHLNKNWSENYAFWVL